MGFYGVNEKPTSSKDPFALRRSAIGLLRIIIENNLTIQLKDLINYSINLYAEQNIKLNNPSISKEILVSLCYQPAANRITVVVLKARNLPKMDITGLSGELNMNTIFTRI